MRRFRTHIQAFGLLLLIVLIGCEDKIAYSNGDTTSSTDPDQETDNSIDSSQPDDSDSNGIGDTSDTSGVVCEDNDSDDYCVPFDCNDSDPLVNPDMPEDESTPYDDNCDSFLDVNQTVEDTNADTDIVVIDMDCSNCPALGNTVESLLCAADICDTEVVHSSSVTSEMAFSYETGNGWESGCELSDTYEAVAHFGSTSNQLAPRVNNSYVLLGTGPVNRSDLFHSFDCTGSDSLEQGINDVMVGDTDGTVYDPVDWTIEMTAPSEAKGFRFKYVFFSEEYDDYISSNRNDKFYVILNAPETTDGVDKVINYTDCRDHFEYYDFSGEDCDTATGFCCYIAINSSLSDCCWYPYLSDWVDNSPSLTPCPQDTDPPTDISGTGFECAQSKDDDGDNRGSSTGWLQTSWPIKGGETFTITFHIHDSVDGYWDSQVIIDGFEFTTTSDSGTIPEIIIE